MKYLQILILAFLFNHFQIFTIENNNKKNEEVITRDQIKDQLYSSYLNLLPELKPIVLDYADPDFENKFNNLRKEVIDNFTDKDNKEMMKKKFHEIRDLRLMLQGLDYPNQNLLDKYMRLEIKLLSIIKTEFLESYFYDQDFFIWDDEFTDEGLLSHFAAIIENYKTDVKVPKLSDLVKFMVFSLILSFNNKNSIILKKNQDSTLKLLK